MTLRGLARQRVVGVLTPGNVWVVERALQRDDDVRAALATCQMRGWVEVAEESIPHGPLGSDGTLSDPIFHGNEPTYRLTEGGWAVIRRSNALSLLGVVIAALSLVVAVIALRGQSLF